MARKATARQLSLLDSPSPPQGLGYFPDFITLKEERALIRKLESLDWKEVRMHGVVARRRVVHFGLDYTYDSRTVHPTTPPPDFLKPLIHSASSLLKIPEKRIEEILISKYSPGAGIGWHRDAPAFGDAVFGISLGASCTMKFRLEKEENLAENPSHNERARRSRFESYSIELEPRAAYVISGPARWNWQHSIPSVDSLRYSITLRTLKSASKP